MIKILGSIMVLLSSTFIGYLLANKCKLRVKQLKEIRNNFQEIETEIFYTVTPIIEVMEKISEKSQQPFCKIYKDITEELKKKEGESLGSIWEKSFEKRKEDTALNKDDLEAIYYFGSILGTTDRESQLKNSKLIQSKLMKLEDHAEEEWHKNEKLYKSLGILLGLAIVIILI